MTGASARRPRAVAGLVAFLAACSSSSSTPVDSASVDAKARDAAASPEPQTRPEDACDAATTAYRAARDVLNFCERDLDCAEVWPGPCSQGPFYIHRHAAPDSLLDLGTEADAACGKPACQAAARLGIASCRDGRCIAGRPPAPETPDSSCWDYEVTYLEATDGVQARTVSAVKGTTPHLVVHPDSAGTLRITATWPTSCDDCTLLISEHNSGMANLVAIEPSDSAFIPSGLRHTHTLAVTPGPYHVVGRSETAVDFKVSSVFKATTGPSKVRSHGIAWPRVCED